MNDIMIRPLCECHGEPKIWGTDKRKKDGGSWICSVKRKQSQTRHRRKNGVKPRERNKNFYWQNNIAYCKCHNEEAYIRHDGYLQCRPQKRAAKKRYWKNHPEKLAKSLNQIKDYERQKMETDLFYRLKRDTKRWLNNQNRATYL